MSTGQSDPSQPMKSQIFRTAVGGQARSRRRRWPAGPGLRAHRRSEHPDHRQAADVERSMEVCPCITSIPMPEPHPSCVPKSLARPSPPANLPNATASAPKPSANGASAGLNGGAIAVLPPFPCCGVVVLGRDEHIGGTSLLAERHSCPSASYLCSQPDCWFSRSCRLPTTSPLSPPHVRRRPLVPTVLHCHAECTAGTIAHLATCLGRVVQ